MLILDSSMALLICLLFGWILVGLCNPYVYDRGLRPEGPPDFLYLPYSEPNYSSEDEGCSPSYDDPDGDCITGTAGLDYPVFSSVPPTSFKCRDFPFPGYFADLQTGCQAYHICQSDGRWDTSLCPNGTIFNQEILVCDWWYNVDCSASGFFYRVNDFVHRESLSRPFGYYDVPYENPQYAIEHSRQFGPFPSVSGEGLRPPYDGRAQNQNFPGRPPYREQENPFFQRSYRETGSKTQPKSQAAVYFGQKTDSSKRKTTVLKLDSVTASTKPVARSAEAEIDFDRQSETAAISARKSDPLSVSYSPSSTAAYADVTTDSFTRRADSRKTLVDVRANNSTQIGGEATKFSEHLESKPKSMELKVSSEKYALNKPVNSRYKVYISANIQQHSPSAGHEDAIPSILKSKYVRQESNRKIPEAYWTTPHTYGTLSAAGSANVMLSTTPSYGETSRGPTNATITPSIATYRPRPLDYSRLPKYSIAVSRYSQTNGNYAASPQRVTTSSPSYGDVLEYSIPSLQAEDVTMATISSTSAHYRTSTVPENRKLAMTPGYTPNRHLRKSYLIPTGTRSPSVHKVKEHRNIYKN